MVGRIIHHFLRQFSFLLPLSSASRLFGSGIGRYMSSKKSNDDYLDFQLPRVDAALNLPICPPQYPDTASHVRDCLDRVGKALVRKEDWKQGALLYLEIGDVFKSDEFAYPVAADLLHFNRQYDLALETYVKSLARYAQIKPNFKLSDNFCEWVLGNLLVLHYVSWEKIIARYFGLGNSAQLEPNSCRHFDRKNEPDFRCILALLGLLGASGAKVMNDSRYVDMFGSRVRMPASLS